MALVERRGAARSTYYVLMEPDKWIRNVSATEHPDFRNLQHPEDLIESATYPQPGLVVSATPYVVWRMAVSIMIKMNMMRNIIKATTKTTVMTKAVVSNKVNALWNIQNALLKLTCRSSGYLRMHGAKRVSGMVSLRSLRLKRLVGA